MPHFKAFKFARLSSLALKYTLQIVLSVLNQLPNESLNAVFCLWQIWQRFSKLPEMKEPKLQSPLKSGLFRWFCIKTMKLFWKKKLFFLLLFSITEKQCPLYGRIKKHWWKYNTAQMPSNGIYCNFCLLFIYSALNPLCFSLNTNLISYCTQKYLIYLRTCLLTDAFKRKPLNVSCNVNTLSTCLSSQHGA